MNSEILKISSDIGQILKDNQQTISVAESSSAGLISSSLLAIPGSSAYFLGGAIVYTKSSQNSLLGITDDDRIGIRSSTEECALLYARKIKEKLNSHWALSETGAAGPTGNSYGDSAGHSCFGIVGPITESMTLESGISNREQNMFIFTEKALNYFLTHLKSYNFHS
tara:strand:+ start:159 stop:659 length:501 start_codon:yes stop_codon:yes gene_type:complete